MEHPQNSYLLYGPPASGKSTVAERLSKTLNAEYVSVGNLVRQEVANKTEDGLLLERYLKEVLEYPVDLIARVVGKKLEALTAEGKRFILDGFPKYEREAKEFIKMMEERGIHINDIIVLEAPLEEIIKRVENRRICEECQTQATTAEEKALCKLCGGNLAVREDDQPFYIRRRYMDHEGAIGPTLEVLKEKIPNVHVTSALPPVDKVAETIDNLVSKPG